MANSKPSFVPPIDPSLLAHVHTPDDWLLKTAPRSIDHFNRVLDSIPRNYSWQFMSVEAFRRIGSTLDAPAAAYRHYWRDMLGQIEAYSIMSAWRLAEISRSAVWALGRRDVVCAAILSRAALETAASYAWLQTEIRPALAQVAQGNTPTMIKYEDGGVAKDLEHKLLKVVFASRLEDAEAFYSPTNILTIIQKVATKVAHQSAVAEIYSLLCEVAHPNMLGRSLYITQVQPLSGPGHERRLLSTTHGATAKKILQHSVSALSWSTGTFSQSCVVLQETVRSMMEHLQRVR